jgi:hypothetical protein
LAPSQLYEGSDLKPTTDLRSVFKGVLRDHLGVSASLLNNTIFPASTGILPLSNLVKTSTTQPVARSAGVPSAAPVKVEPPIAKYRRARGAIQVAAN